MRPSRNYAKIEQKITTWLRQYLAQSGCTGFVIGMSGGIDSSVVAVLCRRVTDATLGLILPCGHTPSDAAPDAKNLAKQFNIPYRTYDLTPAYEAFLSLLASPPILL